MCRLSKTNTLISDKVGAMRTHDQLPTHLAAILIADNDGPTLELYAGVLGRHYRVFVCSTQQDMLNILAAESLQLVVLEATVAGTDSWDLIEKFQPFATRA